MAIMEYARKFGFGLYRPVGLYFQTSRHSHHMADTGKEYDLIVYGATGYTGQFVTEEVARIASKEQKKDRSLTWAVAGRNKTKLASVLTSSGRYIGHNLDHVPIIEADSGKPKSLADMASKAKVVINCVGPYHLYGESVVEACIENGASHVDISGEPLFLESMQLKYDKAAEKAGVHIVGSCGLDSIPADVGVCHMIKNFPGVLNSVEGFISTRGGKNSSIHTGTLESAGLAIANRHQIFDVRKQLFPQKLAKSKFLKEKRGIMHKSEDLNLWCIPLPSDEPAVYRTQRYLHDVKGAHPIQYQGFFALKGFIQAFGLLVGALYFLSLCAFTWTRNLLFKYPEIMTAGKFTRAGSTRGQLERMTFTMTLVGKGWKDKLAEGSDTYSTPPDSRIKLKISGSDPGYSATALMLVASAMTILREKPHLEKPGGVMTPGVAFMNTNIIDRLTERGMKVSLTSDLS